MNNYSYIYKKGKNKYETILKYSYPSCQLTDLTDEDKNEIMTNEVEFIKTKCGEDTEVSTIPRVIYDLFAIRFMTRRGGQSNNNNIYNSNFKTNHAYLLDSISPQSLQPRYIPLTGKRAIRFKSQKIQELKDILANIRNTSEIIQLGNEINDYICDRLKHYIDLNKSHNDKTLTFKDYYKIARDLYEEIFVTQFIEDTTASYFRVLGLAKNDVNYHKNLIEAFENTKKAAIQNYNLKPDIYQNTQLYIYLVNILFEYAGQIYAQREFILKQNNSVTNYNDFANIQEPKKTKLIKDIKAFKGEYAHIYLIYILFYSELTVTAIEDKKIFRFFIENESEFFVLFNLMRQLMYFNHASDMGELFAEFNHLDLTFSKLRNNIQISAVYIINLFNNLYINYVQETNGKYEIIPETKVEMHNFINNEIRKNPYKYYFNHVGNGNDILTIIGNVLIYELLPRKNIDKSKILLYRGVDKSEDDVICKADNTPTHSMKDKAYSLSFNTSIFSGAFFDITACTLYFMLKSKYHYVYYTEKTFAEDMTRTLKPRINNTVRFDELFYVPPLTHIEQLLGVGEFWHTRTKIFKNDYIYTEKRGCGISTDKDIPVMEYLKNNMTKDEMKAEFDEYKQNYRKDIHDEMTKLVNRTTVRNTIKQTRQNAKRKVRKNSGSNSGKKSDSGSKSGSEKKSDTTNKRRRKSSTPKKSPSVTPDPTKHPSASRK